jgi:hypothetical protein
MIQAQNVKYFSLITPATVATEATATGTVDTKGYDYATFMVHVDTNSVASNNAATLDLQEGSVTNVSSHTTVSGAVGDTDWTIPTATNAHIISIHANLATRQRYLSVQLTPLSVVAGYAVSGYLSRAKETPITAANQGVAVEVIV